uniref:Chromosome 10 open reading frame 88 n=1 Tax=Sphenodon punctatus TaxID=8508 RepID=A0A8D0HAD8_SPHPU
MECFFPPFTSSANFVVLERRFSDENETPCFLYLQCDPHGSDEIICLGVLSDARNMEIYIGEEYCGTGRGENVCTIQNDSKSGTVTLYKKYLKLECPTTSCKVKLLSIGEKQRVLINKIVVQVKTACTKSATDFPALRSSIDLDKVQTIMDSMGSKLSPGAQQLMDMVRIQQKNSFPLGSNLQSLLGKKQSVFGDKRTKDGLYKQAASGELSQLSNGPLSLKTCLTTGVVLEDLNKYSDMDTKIASSPDTERLQILQQTTVIPRNDFKVMVSTLLQEQASENPNMPNSGLLLPFLQNLCGQVNHLRLNDKSKHLESSTMAKEKDIQNIGVEQQLV